MHASRIAKHVDMMDEEFKEKLALEIRNGIDRCLSFYGNINVKYIHGDDSIDVASLIGKTIAETDPTESNWADTLYTVDKRDQSVTVSTKLGCAREKASHIIRDYLPWAKLANFLDKNTWRDVVIECNGKQETHKCFPYVQEIFSAETNYSYVVCWCVVDKAWTHWDVFISPEHIKKIL
jgi:hypothetical protein